ncbi:MAG: LysR family transcriptional regulator [Pigmentiphaga sp.]|nr:LysR family transcriptional regulator [Pigmentiphaga sp.]
MRSEDVRNFVVVARYSTLLRAAQELAISQPTLSKSVARLERAVGAKLLERLPRGVALTESGRAFVEHADKAALNLQDGLAAVRDLRMAEAGTVTVGLGVSVPQLLLADACRKLWATTNIHVEITGGMSRSLAQGVAAGECDFAITNLPPDRASLKWQVLFADPILPIVPVGVSFGRSGRVTWEELVTQSWVAPSIGSSVRKWFERQFLQRKLPIPEVVLSLNDYLTAPEFGEAVGAITLMPASFLRREGLSGRYRALRTPEDWRSDRTVGLLVRRHGYLSPAARRLRQTIVSVATERFSDDIRPKRARGTP